MSGGATANAATAIAWSVGIALASDPWARRLYTHRRGACNDLWSRMQP
jgi:hypothetical protein